jgi:hypothetical protein
MRISSHGPAAVALALSAMITTAGDATAQSRRGNGDGAVVHVCSRYGKGCISAPVRPGRWGLEVRLPGGSWIDCRRDCRRTLREETIDFFETLNERSPSTWR